MDKMYEFFYMAMLLSAILAGITSLVGSAIGKCHTKVWQYIIKALLVIAVVATIGFFITVMLER